MYLHLNNGYNIENYTTVLVGNSNHPSSVTLWPLLGFTVVKCKIVKQW